MPTPSKSPAIQIVISQQSLNLLRQIIASSGWIRKEKLIMDITIGGKLLGNQGLPLLDSVDWVKPDEEVKAMKPKERAAYLKMDQAWADKEKSFTVSADELDVIKTAFQYQLKALQEAGKLGVNPYLNEIVAALGLTD